MSTVTFKGYADEAPTPYGFQAEAAGFLLPLGVEVAIPADRADDVAAAIESHEKAGLAFDVNEKKKGANVPDAQLDPAVAARDAQLQDADATEAPAADAGGPGGTGGGTTPTGATPPTTP